MLMPQPTRLTTEKSPDAVDIKDIRRIENLSFAIIDELRGTAFDPNEAKVLGLKFTIGEAAKMVGVTTKTIRQAEAEGRLPAPELNENGRRTGYTLANVNRMRAEFNTLPYRADTDEPVILPIQNFKGGVGKSTIAVHLSHYLALQGYRVCVIDADPQASTTALFGFNPDDRKNQVPTVKRFLSGELDENGDPVLDLHYALTDTCWPNVKLIPANLALYNVEYELAAFAVQDARVLEKLSEGIQSISEDFDVVIIDPPPALGMISLSVLRSANAMIVPAVPSPVDFTSTAHFFEMLRKTLETLAERFEFEPSFKFLKVLSSRQDEQRQVAQKAVVNMMQEIYGAKMIGTPLVRSGEVDQASMRYQSVYELTRRTASAEQYKRCRAYMDKVMGEIEVLIRRTWPSHHDALRKQGLL